MPTQGSGLDDITLFIPLTISPFGSYIGKMQSSPLWILPSVHSTSTIAPGPKSELSK